MGIGASSVYDPERKVWSGPKKQLLYNCNVSLGNVLYFNLGSRPKNIQQINDTEKTTLTNEQVITLSKRIALSLLDLGLTSSDMVGIASFKSTYLMTLVFGCFFVNVPFHPVDVTIAFNETVQLWKKTKPKVIFCDGSFYKAIKEVVADIGIKCEIFTLGAQVEGVQRIEDLLYQRPAEKTFQPHEIEDGDQTAVVMCSSGSTGSPKAVTLSNRYFTSRCTSV